MGFLSGSKVIFVETMSAETRFIFDSKEVRSCFILFQWSKVIFVETMSAETRFVVVSVIGSTL